MFTIFTQVPETPQWYLSKNRESDALQSLQWLRGMSKINFSSVIA